jgi:hypothetical protein
VEQWKAEVRERWEKHRRLFIGGFVVAGLLLTASIVGAVSEDEGDSSPPPTLNSQRRPETSSQMPERRMAPSEARTQEDPGHRSLDEVNSTADQYALAREIGYDLCVDPIHPDKAAADPVGYAEEEFGGPGEFDSAREAGCLEALGQ